MFNNLSEKLDKALHTLKGHGKITEVNVAETTKEIRRALLDADVNYKTAKSFSDSVKEKAIGQDVLTSVSPGQLFTKITHDELSKLMGGDQVEINLTGSPAIILIAGLQGSGKTTFSGKLANNLKNKKNKNPMLVACDVYRPAAIDQLHVLGEQIGVEVYAEVTPNPSVMKFVSNKKLVDNDYEFKKLEDTNYSSLAKELFNFSFVKEVFFSENYVSITKTETPEWGEITTDIRSFIREFIADGKKIVEANAISTQVSTAKNTQTSNGNLDDISKQIISILDEYIRPAVASDGGNIMFDSYNQESKTVNVILQGACSGCPSSTVTLKNGIENMLKQLIPGEIEEVVAVNY